MYFVNVTEGVGIHAYYGLTINSFYSSIDKGVGEGTVRGGWGCDRWMDTGANSQCIAPHPRVLTATSSAIALSPLLA